MNPPLISCEDIGYSFGKKTLLQNISLSLFDADILIIQGPSGVGKTTLLSLLGGIYTPTEGSLIFHPTLLPREQHFGYAFTDGPFFECNTLRENIEYLDLCIGRKMDEAHFHDLVEQFEMTDHLSQPVSTLSVGQRERANFIRALVHIPRVVILDEPGANLDERLFVRMQEMIVRYNHEYKMTCIIVAHDPRMLRIGTRSYALNPRK